MTIKDIWMALTEMKKCPCAKSNNGNIYVAKKGILSFAVLIDAIFFPVCHPSNHFVT